MPDIKHVHYTLFGASGQPAEADADGFLPYRRNFEDLPEGKWTAAERWINEAEKAVNERRRA